MSAGASASTCRSRDGQRGMAQAAGVWCMQAGLEQPRADSQLEGVELAQQVQLEGVQLAQRVQLEETELAQ